MTQSQALAKAEIECSFLTFVRFLTLGKLENKTHSQTLTSVPEMYLDASIIMEMICFDSFHVSALWRLKLKTAQYLSKYGSSQWLDTEKGGDTNNDFFFFYERRSILIISSAVVIIALSFFIANNTIILVCEVNHR